jgi:hypothetical protein
MNYRRRSNSYCIKVLKNEFRPTFQCVSLFPIFAKKSHGQALSKSRRISCFQHSVHSFCISCYVLPSDPFFDYRNSNFNWDEATTCISEKSVNEVKLFKCMHILKSNLYKIYRRKQLKKLTILQGQQ